MLFRSIETKLLSKKRYLTEFMITQNSIENKKSFILNEESIITNYGAIYLDNEKFHLTNDTNDNSPNI